MIDSVRKTCTAGDKTSFKFKTTSIAYLVKNFTSGSVTVCFGTAWDDNQSVMVAPGTAETVISNLDPDKIMTREATSTVIVCTEQTGIVEVIRDD